MNYEYIYASDGNGEPVRAVVVVNREVGDMLLNVDSVLNWPAKFIATSGTLDPATDTFDPLTVTVFYGSLSGSMIHIDEFAPGYTDTGHQEEQFVVLKPTTPWADVIAEALTTPDGPSLPPGGTTGQILSKVSNADGDAAWEDAPETGSLSIIPKETPTGAINGTNTVFTTANPYVGGSLQVYINGLAQSNFATETDPSTGQFTLDTAPLTGDNVRVYYHFAPIVTNNADALDGYHLSGILDALFPVGSKYDSGSSPTLPALIASIGTWERFKGRVVVGVDEAQTEFDTFGEQGGAKTHTLTLAQTPAHSHKLKQDSGKDVYLYGGGGTNTGLSYNTNNAWNNSLFTDTKGGGEAHNNLQPYEATYMWKRIA